MPVGDVRVLSLKDRPGDIALCARWNFEQWGREAGRDLAGTEAALRDIACSTSGEGAVIGLLNGKPAGMALLIACDLESHSHLTPWVASVYTVTESRGQGVASAMMLGLERLAAAYGFDAAYLYTESPGFYARLGWSVIETLAHETSDMAVMKRVLAG
nr:GNAT family N-acetyltransferase [Oryzicola mucosus]